MEAQADPDFLRFPRTYRLLPPTPSNFPPPPQSPSRPLKGLVRLIVSRHRRPPRPLVSRVTMGPLRSRLTRPDD